MWGYREGGKCKIYFQDNMCVSTESFMCDNTYPLKCDCQRKGDDGEIRAK